MTDPDGPTAAGRHGSDDEARVGWRRLLESRAYWVVVGGVVLIALVVIVVSKLSSGPPRQSAEPSPSLRALALGTGQPARTTLAAGQRATLAVPGSGPFETLYEGTVDQSDPPVEVTSAPGAVPMVRARHIGRVVIGVLTQPTCPTPGTPGGLATCARLRRSLGTVEITVTG